MSDFMICIQTKPMYTTSIIFIALLLIISATNDDDVFEYNNKLTLKPAELADLVLRERIKTELKKATSYNKHHKHNKQPDPAVYSISADDGDEVIADIKIEESNDDVDMLKNRKVWSRWSKWGECSVSCGSGFMARRRACVAGLCSRGEGEEQRRPCRRTPCPTLTEEPQAQD